MPPDGSVLPNQEPIDPTLLAILSGAGGQDQTRPPMAPQSALPPTNPVQGGGNLASMVQQVSQMPEYSQASNRLSGIGQQEQDIQKQMGAMPQPKRGFEPDFSGSIGHKILQGLMTFLASTGPGQEVQDTIYGPKVREYQSKQKNLASQLAALKEQEDIPTEQLRSLTGLTQAGSLANYRQGQLALGDRKVDVAQQRANDLKNFHSDLVDIYSQRMDLQNRALAVKERLGLMGIQVQQDRNNILFSLGGQHLSLDAGKFNAAISNGEQGIFDQIFQGLGLKNFMGVSVPGTETGVQPVKPGTTPLQSTPQATPTLSRDKKKPAATGGGKKGVYDPKTKQVIWK